MTAGLPPATRTLPVVLRDALRSDPAQARLLIATTGPAIAPGATANAYVDVIVDGVTTRVPRLAGARVVVGAPAYLLATGGFLLYLGTVTTAP